MKKEIIYCDVCGKENPKYTDVKMQIIFTTEQNEGYSTKSYFNTKVLDLCEECYNKALRGQYIFAAGAMGHNNYSFIGKTK